MNSLVLTVSGAPCSSHGIFDLPGAGAPWSQGSLLRSIGMGVSQTLLGRNPVLLSCFVLLSHRRWLRHLLAYGLFICSGRTPFTNLAFPKPLQDLLDGLLRWFHHLHPWDGFFHLERAILILVIPSSLLGLEPFLNGFPQFLSSTEARGGGLEYSQPYGGPGFLR